MDWNGNLVWECPTDVTVDGFLIKLWFGISHIMLQFTPLVDGKLADSLTGKSFVYDCRHPGLFVDSYQEYVLKNRDYDIAMRQIQSEKEVWSQAAATMEGVGYGYAFGNAKGAIAAGLGGVVETGAKWLINNNYDPKIQQQYDQLYARITDQISLVGDSITNLLYDSPFYKYELIMDDATQNRMKADIETNGFYTDEIVNDLQSQFTNEPKEVAGFTVNPVFQADNVIVEGACNVVGKQEVVRRLQNGVEFI